MAAKTDWRTALNALVEVASTDLAERRRLGMVIATAIADARAPGVRHETADSEASGKRKPRRGVQEVAENGERDETEPAPAPPDADPVCAACGERPPAAKSTPFCSSACADGFPAMVVAALAFALELEDNRNAPAAAERFVATWSPKVQVAVAEWAQTHVVANNDDDIASPDVRVALKDFRALFERGAKREIAVGLNVELAPVAPQEREDAVLDAERQARLDGRARSFGFADASGMVRHYGEIGAANMGVDLRPANVSAASASDQILKRIVDGSDGTFTPGRETCTCAHAPEEHTTDAEGPYEDGSGCHLNGCDCRASREGIGRAADRITRAGFGYQTAHREAGSPQIVTLPGGGKLTMVEEPEPACRLCGRTAAYGGAIFCGAACNSRWEAGERPPVTNANVSVLPAAPRRFGGQVTVDESLARELAGPPQPTVERDPGEIINVQGNPVCSTCLKKFSEHPVERTESRHVGGVTYRGTVRILCDGARVSLL